MHPDLTHVLWFKLYVHKLLANVHDILVNVLPKLGGSWASMLFLAGLLLGFRGMAVRRMRYFLLMCLGTFIVVQALGRTQLSEESPEVNSENLLVLLVPLVFMLRREFFLHLPGTDETAGAAIALRCHRRVRGTVVLADDFHALVAQDIRWLIRRIIRRTSSKPRAG